MSVVDLDRLTHLAAHPFTDEKTYCGKDRNRVHSMSNSTRFVDCPECIRIKAAFDKSLAERGRAAR